MGWGKDIAFDICVKLKTLGKGAGESGKNDGGTVALLLELAFATPKRMALL